MIRISKTAFHQPRQEILRTRLMDECALFGFPGSRKAMVVLLALLASACRPAPPPSGTSPTEAVPTQTGAEPLFDEAVLDPPFVHSNAVWAGVALLDYDDDGWLDIFLTNGRGLTDALYRNQGDGTFVDVAAEAGVDAIVESGAAVAGDLDNDGDTDLLVNVECSTGSHGRGSFYELDGDKLLYLNEGDGTFSSHALDLPAGALSVLASCAVTLALADMNGDGFLDLVISNSHDPDVAPSWAFFKEQQHTELVVLYNDGTGNFDEVSPPVWDKSSFVAVPMDVDGDGRLDILQGSVGYAIRVLLQQADGTFMYDEGRAESGRGLWMGIAVADFDGDLDLDFYATNEGLSAYMWGYDNLDDGADYSSVYEVTAWTDPRDPGADPTLDSDRVNPFHSLLLDEGDAYRVAADWSLEAEHLLAGDLFEGLEGHYLEWTDPKGLERYPWAWGAASLDYDSDGWMDVVFTGNNCGAPMTVIWNEEWGAGPGALLRNLEGSGFEDVTWSAGVPNIDELGRYQDGRGLAVGDLNNDGHADFVVANRTYNTSQTDPMAQEAGTPHVWLSRPREGHWLQVDLLGTESNEDGLGSRVWVTSDEDTWLHTLGMDASTNSSSERLLTIGLGTAEEVDILVEFPSGVQVEQHNVAADQRVVIEEGT